LKQINWDQLYRDNAPRLKGVCRRYVADSDIAEDIVQETFITAIDKFKTFKGVGSFEGWIRKIAINKALLFLRDKQHWELQLNELADRPEQEIEMDISKNRTRVAIEKASFTTDELLSVIDNLPPHHKVVFNLHVLDGFNHRQIAEMMNISAGTSKSHLSRARKEAQELLYQRAIQKEPHEYKRYSAFLLLFFRPNYIDRIFCKGLSGFEMAAVAPSASISSASATTLHWGATFLGKAIIAAAVVSTSTGGFFLCQSLVRSEDAIAPKAEIQPQILTDTLATRQTDSIELNLVAPAQVAESAKAEKKRVIVKKTIVVHDTIRLEKPVSK